MKPILYFFICFCTLLVNINTLKSQVLFQESASALGCDGSFYGLGTLGGGISFYDFDNDGWDDITVSSAEAKTIKFFKNNAGQFSEVNFNIEDPLYETKTVQWVDYDNDGDHDLFVTSNTDENRLYRNNGSMQFTDITIAAGLITENHKSYGASWGDYDNDGFLDLFVSSRVSDNGVEIPNFLYRNNGDDTFTNVTSIAQLSPINALSFCAAFIDYNNDNWLDIYVANDRSPKNMMYRNNGDGSFTEVGEETGTDIIMDAMSTTIGDYNKDGFMDIYITNNLEGNVFFKNNGDNTFTNVAEETGTTFNSFSWGSVFIDADNDRDLDLYVSGSLDGGAPFLPSAFYENDGSGNYTIPDNIGFDDDTATSYSNAIGDVNNDGYPDIIVLNYFTDNIFIWENQSNQTNNWLKVKLEGTVSNRQGIGAQIEISTGGEKQYSFTNLGEGYLGQNSSYEFFGIGTNTEIEYVKVEWPSGITEIIENPSINLPITIVEGENILDASSVVFKNDLNLFPNPFDTSLCISPTGNNFYSYRIIDLNGRVIKYQENPDDWCQISTVALKSGVYFLEVSTQEGNSFFKKIIKK